MRSNSNALSRRPLRQLLLLPRFPLALDSPGLETNGKSKLIFYSGALERILSHTCLCILSSLLLRLLSIPFSWPRRGEQVFKKKKKRRKRKRIDNGRTAAHRHKSLTGQPVPILIDSIQYVIDRFGEQAPTKTDGQTRDTHILFNLANWAHSAPRLVTSSLRRTRQRTKVTRASPQTDQLLH